MSLVELSSFITRVWKPEEGYVGNGPIAEVDERVHIHGGGHAGGGSRADAQLTAELK